MAKQNIVRARLILNGVGCIGIATLCLPIGLAGVIGLVTSPWGADPDGGNKALGIEVFCGLIGVLALASLFGTVRKWRGLPDE